MSISSYSAIIFTDITCRFAIFFVLKSSSIDSFSKGIYCIQTRKLKKSMILSANQMPTIKTHKNIFIHDWKCSSIDFVTEMARSSLFFQLLSLVFIWILANTSRQSEASSSLTCDDVETNLVSCLSYVNGGGKVPSSCCIGVKNLLNLAKTRNDRRIACSCVKSLAVKATNDQLKRAQTIPKSCGLIIPFAISRDVDCSK